MSRNKTFFAGEVQERETLVRLPRKPDTVKNGWSIRQTQDGAWMISVNQDTAAVTP